MAPITFLPPIKGNIACLTCGCGSHDALALDRAILVGFGDAGLMKDGECVYAESMINGKWDEAMTVKQAEALAEADPECDWRIFFFAPLYEAEYQRQGPAHWVLVRKGDGFA